jgi:plastocyanin
MKTLLSTALLALALTACAGAGTTDTPANPTSAPTSATSPAPSMEPSAAIDAQPVAVKDFTIEPLELTSGPDVALAVTNQGPTPHNLTIRDDAGEVLGATPDLSAGDAETLSVELAPGSYVMFCSLAGHESLGMRGTLTVEE